MRILKSLIAGIVLIILMGYYTPVISQTVFFKPKSDDYISVSPGMIFTTGKLGEMSEPGPGFIFRYSILNLFNSPVFAGIETGINILPGKSTSSEARTMMDRTLIVPALINCGLNLAITRHFYLSPSISFGAAYFNMTYKSVENANIEDGNGGKNFLDPDIKSGLNITYRFKDIYIGAGAEYGIFIENDGNTGYISGNIITGYRY